MTLKVKSLVAQSCPTLCDPMDCRLPGSSVHGIFQGRVLDELPFPSPVDLPDPGMEPRSLTLYADTLPSEPPENSLFNHNSFFKGLISKNDYILRYSGLEIQHMNLGETHLSP